MYSVHFERFTLEIPYAAVSACSHQGDCSEDVKSWFTKIVRPTECTPDALRAELKEYGAWENLDDDDLNWQRVIWVACCNLKEEKVPCNGGGECEGIYLRTE
jgi:hypothetical protein